MRYVRLTHSGPRPGFPVEVFSEVNEERLEVRKVEQHPDGHLEWADENHETPTIGLSETLMKFRADPDYPELTLAEISREEFDEMWTRARDG